MKKIQPYCFESFQKMHDAGIKLAMGTDLGYDPEAGRNAAELELYLKYGMSTMDALKTATINAAEALWLGDKVGSIDAGKFADIIAVKGNPLDDITLLQSKDNIRMVMKEGEAYVDKISATPRYVISAQPGSWKIIDAQ